jgi:hypothetical protein
MGTLSEGLSLSERVARTIRTLPGQNVRPPWDLALILNPASESVRIMR